MKGHLLNEQNAMANFKPFKCIELFFVPWQVAYKNCDKSFISKSTFFFLTFVPQLIKKMYRAGTTWFYRFACMIGAQAHISLMTRLFYVRILTCFCTKYKPIFILRIMLSSKMDLHYMLVGSSGTTKRSIQESGMSK